MTIRVYVPAVALAAAAMLVVWTSSVRATDEGRFTVMLLVIDFVPHARPKWGDVLYAWLTPTIQFASLAECQATIARANRWYQKRKEAFVSKLPGGRSYNNQLICYSERATSHQAITWDVCDRAGFGFQYAKACNALTYFPDRVQKMPDDHWWLQRNKRKLQP